MENPYQSPSTSRPVAGVSERQGRALVISVVAFLVGTSLLTIVLSVASGTTNRIPVQSVRFLLTCGLAACLYRGQPWARYVVVGLSVLVTVLAVRAFPSVFAYATPLLLGIYITLIIGSAACAVALTIVPSVGRFLESQRRSP